MRKVTLITKPGCHLCDAARAVILPIAQDEGASVEEINMLTDEALIAQYAEQIPVTLIDGKMHDYWRVNPQRFRKALQNG